jgi:hypothetical protein
VKISALQQAIYTALTTSVSGPSISWVELTTETTSGVTIQNTGYAPVFIKATSSASAPSNTDGALEFPAANAALSISLSSTFLGISGANRLWAYSWFDTTVAISHPPSTNRTVSIPGSSQESDLLELLAAEYYDPLYPVFSAGSVPQSADSETDSAFPFITYHVSALQPYDTKDNLGGSALVQVDVWDRSASIRDLNGIADAVDARLRRQALTITGATHIETILESASQMPDADGKTKRMLMLYRVLFLSQ